MYTPDRPTRGSLSFIIRAITALSLALLGLVAVAPPATADTPAATTPALPETVSADALPTWQINGVVWSQAIVGNTVYVTGSFTKARPPGVAVGGAGEVDANNIFAYDVTTGNRVASFNHSLNGQGLVVRAAPDGSRIYVGGDFTAVDGVARGHIAAFDTATGNLLNNFAPNTDGQVRAFAITSSTVYAGGNFRSSAGVARGLFAAYNPSNGAITAWAPVADGGYVWSMVLSPDNSRVIASGSFTTINAVDAYGMGSIDANSGSTLEWAAQTRIRTAGANGAISSLSTDGAQVFGTGYAFGTGATFEGTFSADPYTGAINWVNDCLGDTYDSWPMNGVLYTVSHNHDCSVVGGFTDTSPRARWQKAGAAPTFATGTITRTDAYGWNYVGLPYAGVLHWFPDLDFGSYTDARQAAWTVTGNSDYLVMGGEFPTVNGTAQQGLVRFAKRSIAPNAMRPIYNSGATPTPIPTDSGVVKVIFTSMWDRDDKNLTYALYRNSGATKLATWTSDSTFWNLPTQTYTDTGLTPGSQVRYQIYARDASGNTQWSAWSNYVTVSDSAPSAYAALVKQDGASHEWRLTEPVGSALAVDDVGSYHGTYSGMNLGTTGAITDETGTGVTASSSSAKVTTADISTGLQTFSVEAWVKTTSSRGGRILGFGNSSTGNSNSATTDRVLYLDTSGRPNFSVYSGGQKAVTGRFGINDGQWHHVVGTLDPSQGMQLFVDGVRVGRDQRYVTARDYDGYWRIGSDTTTGFTNRPSDTGLQGSLDELAVYPTALTTTEIQSHYLASGRSQNWATAPTGTYAQAVMADSPDTYWRLGTVGSTVPDVSGNGRTGNVTGGVTGGQPGAIAGDDAALFATNGLVVDQYSWNAPQTYSEELWFNTTTTRGGKLIGFGNATSGLSSSYDRHVWMLNTGQLSFGAYNGGQVSITSASSYNDGQWHHVVASQDGSGMKLWIDSALVASNSNSVAQAYVGYWRIGGDRVWSGSSNTYFNGYLDDVAIYPTALSEASVRAHYEASGRSASNRPPTAFFTSSADFLNVSVDASASSDPDGALASYTWDFGDGGTGTGVTTTHTYAAAGTYTITLTVADPQGATDVKTGTVTVGANQAPVASFTHSGSFLALSVDGSGSSDADGTVASYAWDFGDGHTGTGATATHTYAAAGTYTVTLTVTDDRG
ncbi:MAG: PKD domain-containing protein, partial [Propionibacteriaceae bacterium]|nr:PKD domain-containing protein [Propionibacteriaceae bacterium]